MSSFGDNYVLASGRTGHDRLRVLCEIHDPYTRHLLQKAGLGSTHRYVEFGCGLGYVARWAATQAAYVTATDLSQDQLAECQRLADEQRLKNIEFRTANIYEPDLAPESYDFSYSRWLLMHLNRPVDAMRKIREALKPGGIMVCEEADLSAIYTEPPTNGYHSYRDLALVIGESTSITPVDATCTSGRAKQVSKSSTWTPTSHTTSTAHTRISGVGHSTRPHQQRSAWAC